MSADNWAVCPRCNIRWIRRIDALQAQETEAYGKVSVEEYDALREKTRLAAAEPMPAEFREDYEIYGAEDGQVIVTYRGECRTCKLLLSFKHVEPIPGAHDPGPAPAP